MGSQFNLISIFHHAEPFFFLHKLPIQHQVRDHLSPTILSFSNSTIVIIILFISYTHILVEMQKFTLGIDMERRVSPRKSALKSPRKHEMFYVRDEIK